jgi:hypothetical protein
MDVVGLASRYWTNNAERQNEKRHHVDRAG